MNLQSCNFPGTISLELLCHLKKWIRFWIGCVKAHPWAYTTPLVKDQAVFKLYNVCKSNLANFPGITSLELLYHLKKWIRFWIGCINDCPRAYTTPLVKDLAVFTMYNVRICNLLEIYIYLYNLDTCLFQDSLEVYAQGCALVQPIQNRFHFIKRYNNSRVVMPGKWDLMILMLSIEVGSGFDAPRCLH